MPQLSLYITDENLNVLRARASAKGVSMSRYANSLIEKDAENNGWPNGFWDLYGTLDEDFVIPEDNPADDDAEFEAMFA